MMDILLLSGKVVVLIMAIVGAISIIRKIYDFNQTVNKDYIEALKGHIDLNDKVIHEVRSSNNDLLNQLEIQKQRAEANLGIAAIYSRDVEKLTGIVKKLERKVERMEDSLFFFSWAIHRERFVRRMLAKIIFYSKPVNDSHPIDGFFQRNVGPIMSIVNESENTLGRLLSGGKINDEEKTEYMSKMFLEIPIEKETELFSRIEEEASRLPPSEDSNQSS